MKAILIILFFALDFIYADECDNIMVEYLKSYNPLNFSNPVVNSGTGYNVNSLDTWRQYAAFFCILIQNMGIYIDKDSNIL